MKNSNDAEIAAKNAQQQATVQNTQKIKTAANRWQKERERHTIQLTATTIDSDHISVSKHSHNNNITVSTHPFPSPLRFQLLRGELVGDLCSQHNLSRFTEKKKDIRT